MVQLWGNPHVEVHVQLVVVGDEGPSYSAAWDEVHHGRLHLPKADISHQHIGGTSRWA